MKIKQIPLTGIAFLAPSVNESTEQIIEIDNVLMPSESIPPSSGVSLYYGSKMSTTKSLSLAFTRSAELTKKLLTIPMELPLQTQDSPTTSREDLPHVQFLNIERIDKNLANVIHGHYLMYANKECPEISSLRTLLIAIRKDLGFLDYLHQQPDFNHLIMIAYPVVEDNNEKSTRATIFRPEEIDASLIKHPTYKNTKFVFQK